MNKKQKIILAIFIPIIVFFIVLTITYYTGVKVTTHMTGVTYDPMAEGHKFKFYGPVSSYKTHTHNPFDWGKTWYMWFLFLIFCCIFEYKLFADKKIKEGGSEKKQ